MRAAALKARLRIMARLISHSCRLLDRGLCVVASRRRFLVGRRHCRRQWLADGEPHGGDFRLLRDDDFLRHAPELLVLTVTQLGFISVGFYPLFWRTLGGR